MGGTVLLKFAWSRLLGGGEKLIYSSKIIAFIKGKRGLIPSGPKRLIAMDKESRITLVSPEFETCAECYVKLMIYPGGMSLEKITRLMTVVLTSINVAGSSVTNSRGVTRRVKESGWFVSIEGCFLSKDIRGHVDWLVKKHSPSRVVETDSAVEWR